MAARPKLLLLDDDPDLVALFKERLSHLPSNPQIATATSGARAIEILESEPFSLLLLDLNMPGMDGLQVLTIVRRKFPFMRTVMMTAMTDEQLRLRAYALGLDLYLEKPTTSQNVQVFLDCIESLLGQEVQMAGRWVYSKNLADIIQIECLSQSSVVLKIAHENLEGKIWFHRGQIIDAVAQDISGEAAFHKIVSWKTGAVETSPSEPARPRSIQKPFQELMQARLKNLDRTLSQPQPVALGAAAGGGALATVVDSISSCPGVEFVLATTTRPDHQIESRHVENPKQLADWIQQIMAQFRTLGEELRFSQFERFEGVGLNRHVAIVQNNDNLICVGFEASLSTLQIRQTINNIIGQ